MACIGSAKMSRCHGSGLLIIGAFAYDDGFGTYGFSWNEPNQRQADDGEIKSCNATACKVVFRVGPTLCGAIALTDDGKVWGGATRPTRAAAELAAIQNCQKRTLAQCRTGMSLHVLAYNLKRMITIFGVGPLMAAIRT
jgi:hypothetical protein